jgi:hypothetical protein
MNAAGRYQQDAPPELLAGHFDPERSRFHGHGMKLRGMVEKGSGKHGAFREGGYRLSHRRHNRSNALLLRRNCSIRGCDDGGVAWRKA